MGGGLRLQLGMLGTNAVFASRRRKPKQNGVDVVFKH